jgi:glucose uptake protein GlcU
VIGEVDPPKIVTVRMRIIGCILAVVSGLFFGLVFTPSTYIQDHRKGKYPGASKNGLHYIFSMYTGILLASFFYYFIYILFKRNRPYIHIESILPAFVSGIMWGIAQAGFLVANSVLSQAISFPLISTGPATIATFWSILYFKDIVGTRNYLIFAGGSFLRVIAAVFIILSKPIPN